MCYTFLKHRRAVFIPSTASSKKRGLTEQIEIMVAGRAGVMLVLAVAAQSLLVVALAAEAIDAFAGEEHNKENGDNDKRHKQ